jgi:hypothetical protein
MDPETLQANVREAIGRELSTAEATRIGTAAERMLSASTAILKAHPGGVPSEAFDAVLRELASPANRANKNE